LGPTWYADIRNHFLATGLFRLVQGRMWAYDPQKSLWNAFSKADAECLASTFLDENDISRPTATGTALVQNNASVRRELVGSLWSHAPLHEPNFFTESPPGVAVGNSFLVVTPGGLGLVPRTAEHRSRFALQMELPEDLNTPEPPRRYLEALGRVFGAGPDSAKKIAAFQEFLGACRTGIATNYERAIVMPGGGSNGKSTIIMGAVESLFDGQEVRSITPNFLNQEYYLMEIRGAAINFVTELPKEQINCTERFKQIISGEDVTGRPIREMPVTFRPSAGHIFACNNFPRLSDNSKGMWRRLLVLRCDASFGKNDGLRADLVEAFRKEAPQILLWALEGARRLMAQGDYTYPQSHFEEEAQWRGSNDKSLQFVTDCTKGFGSGWSRAGAAHKAYQEWHVKKGFSFPDKLDAGQFGSALRHLEGFNAKRQSHGMVYNFVVKPVNEWRDIYLGEEGGGNVQLEEEAS
jgi:putative DNA primase/helicase